MKKKNKLEPKQVKWLFIAGGIIFTLFLILSVCYKFSTYEKLKKSIKIKEIRVSKLEEDIRNMYVLLEKYEKEKAEFNKLLFKKRDIPAFLKKISAFAKKSRIDVVSLKRGRFSKVKFAETIEVLPELSKRKISKEKKKKKRKKEEIVLTYLPINVHVKGKFENLVDFLIYLEKYRQLLTLTNVKIKRKNYPILDCEFVIKIYSLTEVVK